MTLIGELLYDPKNNTRSNQVFESLSESTFENLRGNKPLDSYETEWLKMSKILLWEYKHAVSGFAIPQPLEGQEVAVRALPNLYSSLTEEKRDAIIRKYLLKSDGELDAIALFYGKSLGLKF